MERLIYSSPILPKPLLLPRRASIPLLFRPSYTPPHPPLSFVSDRPCPSSLSDSLRRFPVCFAGESGGEAVPSSTPAPAQEAGWGGGMSALVKVGSFCLDCWVFYWIGGSGGVVGGKKDWTLVGESVKLLLLARD